MIPRLVCLPLALLAPTVLSAAPTSGDELIPWIRLYGRMHVMLVHFPIALLLAAVWFELISRVRGKPADTALRCLSLGASFALLAAAAGWINADLEGVARKAETTLLLHRILGIATASLALTAWISGRFAVAAEGGRSLLVYRLGLLGSALTLVVGSHLGGTLVYGEGYLTDPLRVAPEPAASGTDLAATRSDPETPGNGPEDGGGATPEPVGTSPPPSGTPGNGTAGETSAPEPGDGAPASSPGAPVAFESDVLPIFEASCVQCHGPKRQRAMLRLDQLGGVFEGDRAEWVIQPGDPEKSLLYQRITLPPDHEDFMPAKGDPLTAEQVDVIRRWIAAGAPWPGQKG